MKKIEERIQRKTFTTIKTNLNVLGTYVIDKRNLDDSDIYDESKGSRISSTRIKSIPLAKIEIVVSDKDARKAVEMIPKILAFHLIMGGKSLFQKWKKL